MQDVSANNGLCWIQLRGIRVFMHLGVQEAEQTIGHNLTVHLSLQIPFQHTQDCLKNTLDYGEVVQHIRTQCATLGKVHLLEFLCEQLLCSSAVAFPHLYGMKISIEKAYVPIADCTATVSIEAQKFFR